MRFKKWMCLFLFLPAMVLAMGEKPPAQPTTSAITLTKVASGFTQITDMQFVPGQNNFLVVLEKGGKAFWQNLTNAKQGLLLEKNVLTRSEQGLLGLAFHPEYPQVPCLYTNQVVQVARLAKTQIIEWCGAKDKFIQEQKFKETRIIFQVEQPYSNHNAGQVLFGPDGYLYIPLGDGGSGGDPMNHGQNTQSFLGSILRIAVTKPGSKKPYTIPTDNPYVSDEKVLDEIYAYGLRNPWKCTFAPDEILICADVGQDKWEEVNIIEAGGNYGWRVKEATHCFKPDLNCSREGVVDPVFEYSHELGRSITGGHIWGSTSAGPYQNHYIFADFVSGQFWAMELESLTVIKLEKIQIMPSTFAQDERGELFVADFLDGRIWLLKFGE